MVVVWLQYIAHLVSSHSVVVRTEDKEHAIWILIAAMSIPGRPSRSERSIFPAQSRRSPAGAYKNVRLILIRAEPSCYHSLLVNFSSYLSHVFGLSC